MAKDVAFKPCDNKSTHHSLQNRNHNVHMLLNSCSKNSQKRKFDQHINGGKFASSFELVDKVKYDSENANIQRRNSSSRFSHSTLSNGDRTMSEGRQEYVFPAFCRHCTQDYSHLSDYVDYMKGPNYVMDEESFNIHYRDLMVSNSYSLHTKTSVKKKPKEEDLDIVDSLKKFLPSRGNYLSRSIIPIGPRFQAEVPKWEDTTNKKQYDNNDCLKWLGTQIWPMSDVCKPTAEGIGKGMLDSCLCCNPESVDCIEKLNGEA